MKKPAEIVVPEADKPGPALKSLTFRLPLEVHKRVLVDQDELIESAVRNRVARMPGKGAAGSRGRRLPEKEPPAKEPAAPEQKGGRP